VLPRASIIDPRPLAAVVRRLAWWRTHNPAAFLFWHAVTAGTLQIAALLIDVARAGRTVPSAMTILWAWLGLIVIAAIPAGGNALIGVMRHRPASRQLRLIEAAMIGGVFYGAFPVIAIGGSIVQIGILLSVAVTWHLVIALAPPTRLPEPPRPT
jgi:hypothetical protein